MPTDGKNAKDHWDVFELGSAGRVQGGGEIRAQGWLEAIREFAAHQGLPVSVAGLVSSVRSDGSFLVYEPSGTRGFYVRPHSIKQVRLAAATEGCENASATTPTLVGLGKKKRPHPGGGVQIQWTKEAEGQAASGSLRDQGKDNVQSARRKKTVSTESNAVTREPAVVVEEALLEEINHLEGLAAADSSGEKNDQAGMLPHRVMRCAEARDGTARSELRCALVVWPDPPREALGRLIGHHLQRFRNRLDSQGRRARLIVAAFDHAFHKVAMEPPLAAGIWESGNDARPKILFGDEAAATWPQSATGVPRPKSPGESGRVMVPAIRLDAEGRPRLASLDSTAASAKPVERQQPQTTDDSVPPAQAVESSAASSAKERSDRTTSSLLFMAFERLKPLYEASTRKQALDVVIETIAALVKAKAGGVFLYDEQRKTLRLVRLVRSPQAGQNGPEGDLPLIEVAVGGGLVGTCARQGVTLSLSHVQRDVRFGSGLAAALGINPISLLAAPVQYEGRLWGAIEMIDPLSREAFTGGEVEAVGYAGRLLGERLALLPQDDPL